MKTVRETEFPRIQMFMHSYTGATKWESEFKIFLKCQQSIK